jgi:hypothetical protein
MDIATQNKMLLRNMSRSRGVQADNLDITGGIGQKGVAPAGAVHSPVRSRARVVVIRLTRAPGMLS